MKFSVDYVNSTFIEFEVILLFEVIYGEVEK